MASLPDENNLEYYEDHYEDHHNGVTFPQEYVISPKEIKNIKASSKF